MSHEETTLSFEEILSAYRKGDEERHPDDFSKALNALESDQELEQWFEADQAFDDGFRDALSGLKAPEPKTVTPEPARILRFPFLKLVAAAAVVAIIGAFAFGQYSKTQNRKTAALVNDLRQSMAAFAASSFELDLMDNDLSNLRNLNITNGGTFGDALDTVFARGLPMGCKVVDWDGRKVSLYCFGNEQGQVVHAFVMPLEQLNGKSVARHLKGIVEFSERDTGGFVAGDTAYLLVSSMPGVDIKPFLLPAQEEYLAVLIHLQSTVAAID